MKLKNLHTTNTLEIYSANTETTIHLPIVDGGISAGFPSPADDFLDLSIEGIYSTQKDLAEELVLKSIIYNENYLKSLSNSFKKLYPNKIPMAERLLVGNYTRVKDIHKRSMSKFTQDIARQLKLIK